MIYIYLKTLYNIRVKVSLKINLFKILELLILLSTQININNIFKFNLSILK